MARKRKKANQKAPHKAEPEKKIEKGKRYQAIYKAAKKHLADPYYQPAAYDELIQELQIPPYHEEIFAAVMKVLLEESFVELKEDKYVQKKIVKDRVTGMIRMHPRGFGFVQPDQTDLYSQDIFIPKPYTQNAVDGDRVDVEVHPEQLSPKGPEGKVIAILSRGRTHVAGIIVRKDRYGNLLAYVPIFGMDQAVIVEPWYERQLRDGDRVVMEVVEWGDDDSSAVCKVDRYLGHILDASCDIKAAIEEYDLRAAFPEPAVNEAKKIGSRVSQKDMEGREDLRGIECFTIDPTTAKDFDDALSLRKDHEGNYHLLVHIADVSHYVKKDSPVDMEAKLRCNSTYFPGCCVPMLPPELSENLCSLKPKVNRLVVTVFIEIDKEGNLRNYRIARSVIKSAKRFTYREAKEVLDGAKNSPHAPTLHLMVELCHLLKRKRFERGSIEFVLPEMRINIAEDGIPTGTEVIHYDITHQLVEEFMLKANEIVATHLCERGIPVAYRIHDRPAEENLRDFAILAGAFGYKLSETPTQTELQNLFNEALDTEYGQYLATSYIRRMRLAVYSPDNIGHYGLSLSHYCHFTSPIRRYADLLIHRAIFGEVFDRESLEVMTNYCSEQERVSSKAENSVILLKKLRLLNAIFKKEPEKVYTAIVTRVRNFGIFFEILDYMLEGFFSLSELHNDYYIFMPEKEILFGTHSNQSIKAGERIEVRLQHVDFITLESRWTLDKQENYPKKRKKR
jgi:ribonuclease R